MTSARPLAAAVVAVFLLSNPAAGRADVVIDWNAIMQSTVAGQNPFAQARLAAITQLAVFEAVNAISREYEPYLGTVDAPRGASAEAAAVTAAHVVLRHFFPGSAAALDAARIQSLAGIPDGQSKTDGANVGEAAAAALIAARALDGSTPPQFHQPASAEPGVWQPTVGCPPAGGLLLHWRNVTPFGLESSAQFRSDPPPALNSRAYGKDFDEVVAVGDAGSAARPEDRAAVARFYNTVLAVAAWNGAARQVAVAEGTSLTENARAFALLNMTISDALVSVMETKYVYGFWRPETAAAAAATDGNDRTAPDPGFTPYLPTPCFPGYPSAHASASYGARYIVERVFGAGGHAITLSSASVPGVTLPYSTFKAMTDDIDDARVYGGIHFRFDQDAGARQGREIGKFIDKNFLRRIQPAGGEPR